VRRIIKADSISEIILTCNTLRPDEEEDQENRLLVESGALSKLLKQAQQEKPSPDWKKELHEL
jgi:hypothetical protein